MQSAVADLKIIEREILMKFLCAGTIDNWSSLDSSRADQTYRNKLAEALRMVVEQIQNHGSSTGGVNWPGVSIHFKLESAPIAKPEGEAA
jgi:hypothetical protein